MNSVNYRRLWPMLSGILVLIAAILIKPVSDLEAVVAQVLDIIRWHDALTHKIYDSILSSYRNELVLAKGNPV